MLSPMPVTAQGQGDGLTPLSKAELIDLLQQPIFRDNPDEVLKRFVRPNKIAFLPTRQVREELSRAGVPETILEELSANFASTIVYRVARFKPTDGLGGDFTRTLIFRLENVKFVTRGAPGHVLFGKTFNPLPTGPDGPTREELLENPRKGYVVIMGQIDTKEGNEKTISARLAFVSVDQQLMSIAQPQRKEIAWTPSSIEQAAEEIAQWSIQEVERQLR